MHKHPNIDAPDADYYELVEEITYNADRYGFECVDSFRATPTNLDLEVHFKKATCCGSWEGKYICKSGNEYFIGCNYGH